MEIDKKIIRKLIEVLEDLKKSLKGNEIINNDDPAEEEINDSKTVIKSPIVEQFIYLLNLELSLLFQLEKKLKKVKLY